MALTPGTRLGPYEIQSALGAGGMGEVYRARDTRLKRDVALKILPESFAADADRLTRFQREAEVLASLNNPNIAAIYGLEQQPDVVSGLPGTSAVEGSRTTHALVLELVEGPTLAERIAQGPLPLDEALSVARQVANALEAAHEQGIIHRDLKPANVKVRRDGTVKVLDFGLAKALESESVAAGTALSMAPTITSPAVTKLGVILGTAAYMSPEQARGKPVDQRTDIWAFGCLFYEMLTGRQVFEGDTVSDAVAAILTREPEWIALPADVPVHVRRLLRRCLQKDPVRRLRHIADAWIEIEDGTSEPAAPVVPATSRVKAFRPWVHLIPWALTALAFGIAGFTVWNGSGSPASATQPVRRLEINLPAGVELFTLSPRTLAISPDGHRVAFVGVGFGSRQVYVRAFDQFEAIPLKGSDGVNTCFFSPDGRSIGLVTGGGEMRVVSLADGQVTTVTTGAASLTGATWTADDRIVFVRDGALWQISPSGGTPTQLTTLGGAQHDTLHGWPIGLPDGKTLLFAAASGGRWRIDALTPATGERRTVVERGILPFYVASGRLAFFRDGDLLTAPFDAGRLELSGPAVRVAGSLPSTLSGVPVVDVSSSGTIVFLPTTATNRLVWVSRQGIEQPLNDVLRTHANPRLDPKGNRVLVEVEGGDLWMQDVERATFTRLTSNPDVLVRFPIWAPDGRQVVYRTTNGLRVRDADGTEAPVVPNTSEFDYPSAIAPDGDTLVFIRSSVDTSFDVYTTSLRAAGKIQPVVNTPAYEGGARLSPDGRWLTYVSNDSGRNEIYLRPFPGPGRQWQISTEGGTQAIWNPNGREIFYRTGNQMMAVELSTTPEVKLSPPRLLFERPFAYGSGITIPNYDVTRDGQRFVMIKEESTAGRLNVVLNWSSELGR